MIGVATYGIIALTAATGNATGQVAGMAMDAVQGNEVRSFDSGQVATAAGIGLVASTAPGLATSSQMGVPANISAGLFETLVTTTSSGLSTGGQIVSSMAGAAIEVTSTLAGQQAEKVYENN